MANQYHRLMQTFHSLVQSTQNWREKKGYLAEKKASRALHFLKLRGEIRGYIWTSPDKKLDNEGRDFVISVIKGDKYRFVSLQIKSSQFGVFKHKERKKMAEIPAVAVNFKDSDYDVAMKIRKAIMS